MRISKRIRQETLSALEAAEGNQSKAARMLGINRETFRARLRSATDKVTEEGDIEFNPVILPGELLPVKELLERRKKQFAQKAKHEEASKLIPVGINVDGPIGILHIGDPHVDDDGTDIETLERHVDLIHQTEGLFGANVGDTTNNWTGRLARLYADQSTSAAEAWQLAEWFLTKIRWLYILGGNHDIWSGAGDPITWISRQTDSLYKSSEVRMSLNFPNGRSVRVNARHDFSGYSQYNPAHGAMKALQFGVRDHIATCGHRHVSGYGVLKDSQSGITMHAIQIASYKIYDRYAREKGFRDQSLSPCAMTIIDPSLQDSHPDLVKVFWSPEEGVEFLNWKRRRK